MWVQFKDITYREDLVSKKTGNNYSGWEATGIKKGYNGAPDAEWSKVFFDNQVTTIIENGVPNNGQSIVQFLLKGCKEGDTLIIKMERDGSFWRIVSMENYTAHGGTGPKPTYVPLSEQQKSTEAQLQAAGSSSHSPASLPW